MDEPVNVILGDSLSNPHGTLDMHVLQGEVPRPVSYRPKGSNLPGLGSLGRVVAANQVVDDVRVPDALLNRLGVVEVVFLAST